MPVLIQDVCDRLMKAARGGDWRLVEAITAEIMETSMPRNGEEFENYLRLIKETLVTVKAARADLAMSAVRLSAAAGFAAGNEASGSLGPDQDRQYPGVVASF